MKLYQIEDNPGRRAFIDRICSALNELSGLTWINGFGVGSETAWHDPRLILDALYDDEGVILLDIHLEDGGSGACASARKALEEELTTRGVQYVPHLYANLVRQRGSKVALAQLVLAAAIALGRVVVVTSAYGYGGEAAGRTGVGFAQLPDPDDPKDAITEVIELCAEVVWERSCDFTNAAAVWEQWSHAESSRIFPSNPDPMRNFHDIEDWLDERKKQHRPMSEDALIEVAQRLLSRCRIGACRLDFLTALRVLKAVARSQANLAVTLVETLVGCRATEGGVPASLGNDAIIVCSTSGGRALVGLARLDASPLNSGEAVDSQGDRRHWTIELERNADGDAFIVTEHTEFKTEVMARDAGEKIRLDPQERRARGRTAPGDGTTARYWLAKEAIEPGVSSYGNSLALSFKFQADGI